MPEAMASMGIIEVSQLRSKKCLGFRAWLGMATALSAKYAEWERSLVVHMHDGSPPTAIKPTVEAAEGGLSSSAGWFCSCPDGPESTEVASSSNIEGLY